MTVQIEHDHFVAYCDGNRGCFYNELGVKSYPAQLQQGLAIDLAPPLADDEGLHASDGKVYRRADPRAQLSAIERKQLAAFVEVLKRDGWKVEVDRARALGYLTICRNHNPGHRWELPPID